MTVPVMNLSMVGQTYAFKSKDANDTTVYQGMIMGFVNSAEAQKYMNIVSYNQAVRQADPTVPSDVTQLSTFLIFRLSNTTGNQTDYAFAPEWMLDGSFTLQNQTIAVTLEVLDTNLTDHTGILQVLYAAGYTNSRIVSTSA